MTNSVGKPKVKAVRYANVWTIQDAAGHTVARMTVNGDAQAWATRIRGEFLDVDDDGHEPPTQVTFANWHEATC